MTRKIEVQYGERRGYPVHVGMNIWDSFHHFCRDHYSRQKIFVVIDSKVSQFHGEKIGNECSKYFDSCITREIPEGEGSKSISQWNNLANFMLKEGIERNTPVLAVGGGVTGDLAGFAASTVLRGVPLLHMPTSLLAMIDSSIGGKTGVNHETGKNLIGSFYQPEAVFAGAGFLETLEKKEWINGLAEILKYAAISEPMIFDKVAVLTGGEFTPGDEWVELIEQSISIKAGIVREDTLETGKRAFLNFGHTFGHALEKVAGYGTISHGQAVFVGMIAALYASRKRGAPLSEARFAPFFSLYPLQLHKLQDKRSELIHSMFSDKKVKEGAVRLVLLKDWGNPYLLKCNDRGLLEESWSYALEKFNHN